MMLKAGCIVHRTERGSYALVADALPFDWIFTNLFNIKLLVTYSKSAKGMNGARTIEDGTPNLCMPTCGSNRVL
jgi:hypothetical protein